MSQSCSPSPINAAECVTSAKVTDYGESLLLPCSPQHFSVPIYIAALASVKNLDFSFHQLERFHSGKLCTMKFDISNFLLMTDSHGLVQIKEAVCLRSLPDGSGSQVSQHYVLQCHFQSKFWVILGGCSTNLGSFEASWFKSTELPNSSLAPRKTRWLATVAGQSLSHSCTPIWYKRCVLRDCPQSLPRKICFKEQ